MRNVDYVKYEVEGKNTNIEIEMDEKVTTASC
jgi:hypothetical protein